MLGSGGSAPHRSEGWGCWGVHDPPQYTSSTPLGMFWVGSEEAQMGSGVTVYILIQLKRIIINISVFALFVFSKGDSVDKKIDLENVGPLSQYLIPAKICAYRYTYPENLGF